MILSGGGQSLQSAQMQRIRCMKKTFAHSRFVHHIQTNIISLLTSSAGLSYPPRIDGADPPRARRSFPAERRAHGKRGRRSHPVPCAPGRRGGTSPHTPRAECLEKMTWRAERKEERKNGRRRAKMGGGKERWGEERKDGGGKERWEEERKDERKEGRRMGSKFQLPLILQTVLYYLRVSMETISLP